MEGGTQPGEPLMQRSIIGGDVGLGVGGLVEGVGGLHAHRRSAECLVTNPLKAN